jgi:hypothetical protein
VPLSFAQERLWFLDQLEPGLAVYNLPFALRLRGPLQVSALERSLQEILRRHESLRTTFPAKTGRPRQVVGGEKAFRLTVCDLRKLPLGAREAEARKLAVTEAQRPFELSHDLLLRASLFRLGEDDHLLLLTLHHIAFDGWSLGILCRELGVLYSAYSAGTPSPLTDLPLQYADFAVWQRSWMQGELLAQQLAYWRERFAGAPAVLEFPTDHPRPPLQSYRGARAAALFEPQLAQALEALSRREGVTLFMTLLAAFKTLLFRYSGQETVVVGCPFAGRNRAELEGLMGFFLNTLALRTDISHEQTFRELLRQVRKGVLEAHAHQDLPFEKLVAELRPERSLSYSPLFQVMFQLRNPNDVVEIAGLRIDTVEIEHGVAPFDLAFDWLCMPR